MLQRFDINFNLSSFPSLFFSFYSSRDHKDPPSNNLGILRVERTHCSRTNKMKRKRGQRYLYSQHRPDFKFFADEENSPGKLGRSWNISVTFHFLSEKFSARFTLVIQPRRFFRRCILLFFPRLSPDRSLVVNF